ncbi:hypothetical protein NQ314_016477 [Rhamnusium bicolor]|uniref:Midasin n=1 Tax=Rhamnusium bicolor TaxID=1586634 RepID=A0AAV8WWR9_9CUCU|nr:hypothetical protein NQ314_016477 [Rhamnusium bicolor]
MENKNEFYQKLEEFCEINEQFRIAFEFTKKNVKLTKEEKCENLFNYIAHELLAHPQYLDEIFKYFSQEIPKLIFTAVFFNDDYKFNNLRHITNSILLSKTVKKRSDLQGIACHTLAILLGMNEQQLERLIYSKVTPEVDRKFACSFDLCSTLTDHNNIAPPLDQQPIISTSKRSIEQVISIAGICVPIVENVRNIQNIPENKLLEVPSTYNNLRKIALGLTSNKAVCLQGPVGCGKTSLVEYLAYKTGRKLGDNFVKVQLGDQTDNKMLLGTYRCSDVPGEFIWQPGVLTQAVLEGNWLLLEDIDSASMDIASVLTSLLENHSLTVPGYRDSVPITPGFQLFVTQRFVSTITGHHKKHSNAMALLELHLLQVNIDPLTPQELKQILETHYIEFRTITDRMINVFMLFSRDTTDPQTITIPRSGRLISTRDFFKWCSRAIINFDVKSQASALKVLQDAIDVFCCSYSNSEEALNLAKQISTHLGIINQKAEYFFKSYKPDVKLTSDSFIAGRAILRRENNQYSKQIKFSFTRPAAVLLERIMCCVNLREPVLLVGETGTGKTSSIQYLAHTIGQKLIVINMNQQSDSADLLGGFKPVDLKFVAAPIRREFEQVFCDYFKVEPNKKYLGNIALCFNSQRWSDLVKLMNRSYQAAVSRLTKSVTDFEMDKSNKKTLEDEEEINKNKKDKEFLKRWQLVGEKLHKLELQLKQKSALAFAFVEGSLVKAVENGYWVLLDEINLANAETLECLSGLLEGSQGSLCLLERGDKQPVKRHPNFTLFACMNPSTDVGKKDLPAGLRNRFTEFFVDELNEKSDLLLLVNNYLEAMSLKEKEYNRIVDFYLKVRKETITTLSDGLGHKPHFSLRSLCRALVIASKNPCGMFKRSLYEAFCLSFLTQLDNTSYQIVEKLISSYLIGDEKSVKAVTKQPIPEPQESGEQHLKFESYWVRKGSFEPVSPEDYILTASVRKNLKDLVRVVSIGKLPGDTSVGKTSLIAYLAKSSGNKCVRINNHEHTDLQEYIGSYVADTNGKLVFREGLLVEAMRKGHWIILDELNLAPTDVLEALNRVLDDNRELFIPETQETIKADPNFMLFATQNPPGAYGGRKMLSRAFRNRFVELHFNEIPPTELEVILHKRCQMAPSYAKKMINVMTELQGFITLRDLFRWGERYRLAQNTGKLYDWDQHLADEGYLVLAGRVRRTEEKCQIVDVLQKHLKREVKPENLFTLSDQTSNVTKHILVKIEENHWRYKNIVWTYNMRQLAVLVAKALEFKEPVLLVGETGGGKTTVCKLIAENNGQALVTVNCHMHTESSDFIGGLRPVRDHSDENSTKLFEWVDGPLLQAMVKGHVFLADEISLADDSVLERLNSLLDLNNTENSELIVANSNFYFIGTMNPGGDFGKKELSPALRNRFTEIWCESCTNREDLVAIIEQNIKPGISLGNQQDGSSGIGNSIMDFVECLRTLDNFRNECSRFLINQMELLTHSTPSVSITDLTVEKTDDKFGITPFYIELGTECTDKTDFSFDAPTTVFNTLRLLRGMQLNKAILLEGSPGVGKTSLVTALAKFTGHKIFRVNLSDQTDISDLFGADLPVEGGSGGQFSWRDGPLLQALKDGSWILLDELNLASQSVLEGLNACLDHRGEIFIPELGKTFYVKPDKDLHYILTNQFNHLPLNVVSRMIDFNSRIVKELDNHSFGQKGAPWECNLRDLTRWCEAMIYHYNVNPSLEKKYQPESVVQLIYGDRMRTTFDKEKVKDIFEEVFQCKVFGTGPIAYVNKQSVYIGDVRIERNSSRVNANVLKQDRTCLVLRSQLPILRSLAYCVNLSWMSILVGSSGSGKSSVVKTLANLAGKSLKTLPVTSAMDTTDILGGFEQVSGFRKM